MTDQTPIERAAKALHGNLSYVAGASFGVPNELQREQRQMTARTVFASIDTTDLAQALADDWNPDRDPILTAMFRDYAQTVINHLLGDPQ